MSRFSGWARTVWGRLTPARAHRRLAAFQRLLTDPVGQELLNDLALYCNVRSASFVPGDPHATTFNEGQRDVFLHILELAKLDEQQLMITLEDIQTP